MSERIVSCDTCKFVHHKGPHGDRTECRRNAPAPGLMANASWPRVELSDWCGEFRHFAYTRGDTDENA